MAPDPAGFAHEWEAGWNSHDLDRILSHYSDDIVFHSLKAQALVGSGTLSGKAALRAYWGKALSLQPQLRFEVLGVFAGHEMVAIHYRNQKGTGAVENLRFGADGLVCEASACHATA